MWNKYLFAKNISELYKYFDKNGKMLATEKRSRAHSVSECETKYQHSQHIIYFILSKKRQQNK